LLQSAEPADAWLTPPRDLAQKSLRRALARKRRRRAFMGAASLLLVAALASARWLQLDPPVSQPAAEIADAGLEPLSEEELQTLSAEARFHEQTARRLAALADRELTIDDARRLAAEQEPDELVREQLERVAYRLILEADALRAAMQPVREIVTLYRKVLQLFPTTNSAGIARERLAEFDASQGES
jgi:hypothetical protein